MFRVGAGGLSAAPVVTARPGYVPFAVTFDAGGHLVIAEAGGNAVATFTVNANGTLTLRSAGPATGQAATCWIAGTGRSSTPRTRAAPAVRLHRRRQRQPDRRRHDQPTPGPSTRGVPGRPASCTCQAGATGIVDEFHVGADGSLTALGSVTVPDGAGGEGIVAS